MRSTRTLLFFGLLGLLMAATARAAAPAAPATEPALNQALAIYQRGDLAGARQAFERLAALGVPAADYNLAVMHLRAELQPASTAEAVRLMERAAGRGFVTAMVGLAQLHERGEIDGRRDLPTAMTWYRRAAEAGSVEAQVEIGTAHYLGRGAVKDAAQAAHWYREAAKRGEVGAMYLIASMYEQGDGVERDLRLARYWYAQCAAQGDVAAPGKLKELDARLATEGGPQ
jgi:uncharacterized protein